MTLKRSGEMKRTTALTRSAFKRGDVAAERKPAKGAKKRKCKNKACRAEFVPERSFIEWCSPACGAVVGLDKLAKQKAKAAKADRAETKRKLDGFKTIPQLKAEAQEVFNKWVRARDLAAGHGCICCGKFATPAALAQPGGAYDACHYRSRGSADHLRYDERNVHLGLKDCNTWGHVDYRGGLERRIGREALEALEADHGSRKWTREYLEGVKAEYSKRLKLLRAG